MSDQTVIEQKKPAKRRQRHANKPRRKAAMPEEFAGMTEFDCCFACATDPAKSAAARQRLNEIDAAYPRQPARDPRSPTVMETDGEWLRRNPQIAEEFKRMTAALSGGCCISGGVCGHPFKGGLQPGLATPEAIARYERAKKALRDRKIDLTKGGV